MSECRHKNIHPYDGYCEDCGKTCDMIVESMQARIDALEELVAGLEDVRAKEYEFKQARIDALEKAICYHKRDVIYDDGIGSSHDIRLWKAMEAEK